VDYERLLDGGADADARIERRVGVLEDELDVSAVLFQLGFGQRQNILSLIEHLALRGDQFQNRIAGRRLAAARFPDDAEGFAFIHVEIDILHRAHDIGGAPEERLVRGEVRRQVPHLQEGLLCVVRGVDGFFLRRGVAGLSVELLGHFEHRQGRGKDSSRHRAEFRHGLQQSTSIRVRRRREYRVHAVFFDDFAFVHDHDAVRDLGDDSHVVRDKDDRDVESVLERLYQREYLGLNRHVQRRRGLVRDQDLRVAGEGHRDHDALAHASRKLEWIVVYASVLVGNPHQLQKLHDLVHGLRPRDAPVHQNRLEQLIADGEYGVERSHGFLKDHGEIGTPDRGRVFVADVRDVEYLVVALSEQDLAGVGAHVAEQLHDPAHRDSLSRAGFPDNRESFTPLHRKGYIVKYLSVPAVSGKAERQVFYREEFVIAHKKVRRPHASKYPFLTASLFLTTTAPRATTSRIVNEDGSITTRSASIPTRRAPFLVSRP